MAAARRPGMTCTGTPSRTTPRGAPGTSSPSVTIRWFLNTSRSMASSTTSRPASLTKSKKPLRQAKRPAKPASPGICHEEVLAPSFNLYVQEALALVLSDEHRPDVAKQSAAAGCQDRSSPLFGKLQVAGLCTSPPQQALVSRLPRPSDINRWHV